MGQHGDVYTVTDFEAAWDALRPAAELAGEGLTKQEFHAAIVRGDFQIWNIGKSFAATRIDGRTVRIGLAGGSLDDMPKIEASISQWAKTKGANRIEILGRAGWERFFPAYDRAAILLRKDLR